MKVWTVTLLWALGISTVAAAGEVAQRGAALVVDIKGSIGVATTMLVDGTLDRAQAERAELVVLRLDTPGGLVNATREIIQRILASSVPVAVYVAPSGARAASAGTYILYAAHVAAMAPGTHLGAATPIQLGIFPEPPRPSDSRRRDSDGERDRRNGPSETTAERKVVNDAVALLRSLAQLRGRNVEWAEKAVREAATLTAEDAVRERVADLIATDLDDMLAQLDGRAVTIAGAERRLATRGLAVVTIAPDWRVHVLAAITDPNVAFILLMLGIYGILFEFWNPGMIVPGVIGGISLLLSLAALSVLPVSLAGLGLVLLGVSLMVAEVFTPGIGVLGIGGLAAFVVGSIFLFDPSGADIDFTVAWPLVAGAAGTSALLLFFVFGFALRARRHAVRTGSEEMLGLSGHVVAWEGAAGSVRVHGEVWAARGDAVFTPGDMVRVVQRDGLTLRVKPG